MLLAGSAFGVLIGGHFTKQQHKAQARAQMLERLEGTWELRNLQGQEVGKKTDAALISQRMTLRQGRILGVTRLRTGTEAASTAMPFPDASVQRVRLSEDGLTVEIFWDGTYQLTNNNLLDFTIGKAMYGTVLKFDPQTLLLQLEHDTILTYPGAAVYAPTTTSLAKRSAALPLISP